MAEFECLRAQLKIQIWLPKVKALPPAQSYVAQTSAAPSVLADNATADVVRNGT